MLVVEHLGVFAEEGFVVFVFVQVAEVGDVLTDVGLRVLDVGWLFDARQFLRVSVVVQLAEVVFGGGFNCCVHVLLRLLLTNNIFLLFLL